MTIPMKNKTLYLVKLIEQKNGDIIDIYFYATSISQLEEKITEIIEIKVISEVMDLTKKIKGKES